MPTLQDVAGDTGIFTDGNWILSENMDANGKYGVIQLKHVGVGEFLGYKDFNFISEKTFDDLNCTEVLTGDVLISRMADPIGRACIVPQLPFPCVTAVDITIVRIDKNIAEPEFIMHLCNSPSMREKIDRAVRGTTRARITRTELGELEIPLPPLDEQKRIASLLARADRLRQLRRHARRLADSLLQSLFVEMFGDPGINSNGWDIVDLQELSRLITDGTHVTPTYLQSGIPFISTVHVSEKGIDWDNAKYISLEEHRKLTKRCKPEVGDILYTKVGSVGLALPVPDEREFSIFVQLALIKIRKELCNLYYLVQYLNMPQVRNPILAKLTGATMKYIGVGDIGEIKVILPPLPLQEEFARAAARVESLRRRMSESERQAEGLFQSLLALSFTEGLAESFGQ